MAEAVSAPDVVVFDEASDPAVSVVVAAWGSAPHLLGCLASIGAQRTTDPFEVVVVLNDVEPHVLDAVARLVRGAKVITSRSDLGFAGSVNVGVASTRSELLAIIHDDVTVPPGWLDVLAASAASHPAAEVIGCAVTVDDAPGSRDRAAGPGGPAEDSSIAVSECAFLVRRRAWDRLGGLDGIFHPFGFATTDLCARVAETGGHVVIEPRASVRRAHSARMNDHFRSCVMQLNRELFDVWRARANRPSAGASSARAAMATREPNPPAGSAVPRRRRGESRLLVIDDAVPDPSLGAGSGRMAEVIGELVRGGGFQVDVLPLVAPTDSDAERADALGVGVVVEDLERLLAREVQRYAVAIVSRPHNWTASVGTLRRLAPGVPVVYDAEALFHRRLERQLAFVLDAPTALRVAQDAARLAEVEQGIAREADFVVAISEDEADFFRKYSTTPHNVAVHPPFLAEVTPSHGGVASRRDIGFVAGWSAGPESPNADAVDWFARRVLPKVRARQPGVRLRVTGGNPPANVRRLFTPAVDFVGQVADLAEFYATVRVVVVPVRYGSGVKLKTVEAVQYGVPTVATTVGAEGIPFDDRGAVVVTDDPDRFARAVAALLGDDDAWRSQRERVLAQQACWAALPASSVWPSLVERLAGVGS